MCISRGVFEPRMITLHGRVGHCLKCLGKLLDARDLFVLLQLAGHPLGRSFLSFAKRYCAAEKSEYGWKTDGASNLAERR